MLIQRIRLWASRNQKPLLLAAQIIVCLTAAVFIVIGVNRGEVALVLKKAINICLECIGLG